MACMKNHRFCNYHIGVKKSEGCKRAGGVAVIIADSHDTSRILVGKQRGGSDIGQYSIVQGKMDPEDGNCYKIAALRELDEEFKIHISSDVFIQNFTHNEKINYISAIGTMIFVGLFDSSCINLEAIEKKVNHCIEDDRDCTWALREVEDIRWIDINNPSVNISRFCKMVIKKYKIWLRMNKITSV